MFSFNIYEEDNCLLIIYEEKILFRTYEDKVFAQYLSRGQNVCSKFMKRIKKLYWKENEKVQNRCLYFNIEKIKNEVWYETFILRS